MKTLSTTSVTSFLSGVPYATEVLLAFDGAPQVYRFSGLHRFYRAAGFIYSQARVAGRGDAYGGQRILADAYSGKWWVDESVLVQIAERLERAGWLTDTERKQAWPAQYRALTALCDDWNDMSEVFALELPGGQHIEGLVGLVKDQPQFSPKDPQRRSDARRILPGGAEQVFFKVKDPTWVRQVHLW